MEEQRIQGIADLYRLVSLYQESLDRLQRRLKMMNGRDRRSQGVNLSNQIIAILHLRDEIEGLKGITENQKANDIYHEIVTQDLRLKSMSSLVAKSHNFTKIRDLIKPPVERWWWYPIHRCTRLDPIFSFCSIVCLIISLALSIDLIPRFFAGGVDLWGGLGTIVTPLVGWAFGKEALESAPRSKALLERAMAAFEVPLERRQLAVSIFSALFLLISCTVSGMRERISHNYYCMALETEDGNCNGINKFWLTKLFLKVAENRNPEANLKVAIALDPSNINALFYLGWLYERRQELELAKGNYKIAANIGDLRASNRLAVLQIFENLEKSADIASTTLLAGRAIAWNSAKEETRRSWYINIAWSRYLQSREEEASIELGRAKDLAINIPISQLSLCISTAIEQKKFEQEERGKNKQKKIDKNELLRQWEQCKNEDTTTRERDFWRGQANKCIQSIASNDKCLAEKEKTDSKKKISED
jgi:TPR repeat protein